MSKVKTPDDCGDNKVIFRYDDPAFFVGYYAGETWNGWDCVRVDKATFDQLKKICEEQGVDVEVEIRIKKVQFHSFNELKRLCGVRPFFFSDQHHQQ